MRIFVGGLWAQVARADLDELIGQCLRGPWYRLHAPRGQMTACELQIHTDMDTGETAYCAVIEVAPTRLGWEVIQYLEGLAVQGHTLTAHKWFPRTALFDRRVASLEDEHQDVAHERRQRRDRRRNLNIQPVGSGMMRPVQGFTRTYST